jgi:hypothetical protein
MEKFEMEDYTRQQLHDFVSSGPMRDVSKKLEMSDNGLRGHCVKAFVPLPPQGHWNKLKAGSEEIGSSQSLSLFFPPLMENKDRSALYVARETDEYRNKKQYTCAQMRDRRCAQSPRRNRAGGWLGQCTAGVAHLEWARLVTAFSSLNMIKPGPGCARSAVRWSVSAATASLQIINPIDDQICKMLRFNHWEKMPSSCKSYPATIS